MKLSARQIKEASQCLRYHTLSGDIQSRKSLYVTIIDEVLRKSCTQITETRFKPEWKRIIRWVDRRAFEHVDMDDPDSFQKGKTTSEHVLTFLRRWYHEILLPENVLAYPGLALECQVGNTIVWAEMPIIKVAETPIIFSVSDIVQHEWQLYNDFEARVHAWLVAQQLDCDSVTYHKLIVGPRGGLDQIMIELDKEAHLRTGRMVSQVVKNITSRVDYPSVTTHCIECPFRRRCRI